MRFFTIERWMGQDDTDWPLDAYQAHLDRIRSQIPGWFAEPTFSLHHSRLRRLQIDPHRRILLLEVDDASRLTAHNPGPQSGRSWYESGRARLRFLDLEMFESTADPESGLPGPHGYGDWAYEEIDVVHGGLLKLSVLFSSGIEIRMRCRDIEADWIG